MTGKQQKQVIDRIIEKTEAGEMHWSMSCDSSGKPQYMHHRAAGIYIFVSTHFGLKTVKVEISGGDSQEIRGRQANRLVKFLRNRHRSRILWEAMEAMK